MAAGICRFVMLEASGSLWAYVAIGSSKRCCVPVGYGGPHAGYMATKEVFKRGLPGRLVGVSKDLAGEPAYRLALQTREQHIRREKATSNICTAQVLLAVIAGMYAVYHGPEGLQRIAQRVHMLTCILAKGLTSKNLTIKNKYWFDTLTIDAGNQTERILSRASKHGVNLRIIDKSTLGISLDEKTTGEEVSILWNILLGSHDLDIADISDGILNNLPSNLDRTSHFLTHPTFNRYHSETEMLRYLRKLSDKDIALDRSMIPLGSCTMKLNETTEIVPSSWPEVSNIHPFAPTNQTKGYALMIEQ